MKVAILGAGGCFAQNFANYLKDHDIECFGIARSEKPPEFWTAEFPVYYAHIVKQREYVVRLIDDNSPDVIVNFAAQGEGAASFGIHSPDFYRTNTLGLADLIEDLRKRQYVKRFIQIGSSEVYGSNFTPVAEGNRLNPSSPYAISKAAFDQHLEVMHRVHGFPMNIIRPSNCYCPGQQLHRIIPKAIICGMTGKKLPLQGGGTARKSYLYATDLSDAIHRVMLSGKMGATYNVGPTAPIPIIDLVRRIAKVINVPMSDLTDTVPDRVGQDGCYWLDSTAIRNDTGWAPLVDLEEGIGRVHKWVKEWPELLKMPTEYVHRV